MPSHLFIAIRITRPRSSACPSTLASCSPTSWALQRQDDDVSLGDRLQCLGDAGALDRILDSRAPAHPGGIDQQEFAAVTLERHHDAVARGAGLLAGDDAFLADQPIDQRRLADVGPADDGHADGRRQSPRPRSRVDAGERVPPSATAGPGRGCRDRQRLTESERVKVGRHDVRVQPLALVERQHDRLAGAAQFARDELILGGKPAAGIGEQDRRSASTTAFSVWTRICASMPFGCSIRPPVSMSTLGVAHARIAVLPVAGHARHVGDDRRPLRVSALNRVDLPTLGRPTIATIGSMAPPTWSAPLRPHWPVRSRLRLQRRCGAADIAGGSGAL